MSSSLRTDDTAVEGKPVTITFNVLGQEPSSATRTLGEGLEDLHSLRLAVFGGSGYLKEYVEAQPLGAPQDYTYTTTDKDDNEISVTVKSYSYSVTLSLSDSPRTVHFIGNGPETLPFGYDTAVIPTQRGTVGEMSYWQVLSLPDGIRAKRNTDGAFVNKDGEVIPEGGSGFVADADTERAFQDIPIIRNWAKVVLHSLEDSNFTPIRFALVNVPTRGAIAPYSASTGFITGYESLSYPQLEAMAYPGNLPYGTAFDTSIPGRNDFEGTQPGGGVAAAEGSLYLYERPVPSETFPPTYLIVYGHYANPSDPDHEGNYYYKVDLMDSWSEEVDGEIFWKSRYYPVFRNFKYQIVIRKVLAAGHGSPEDAVNSVGSGDVSADINTSRLADISDGSGRLIISPWMAQTLTEEHGQVNPAITVLQAFFSKSPTGEADRTAGSVRVELLPPDDEGNDLLYDLSIDSTPDAEGWRHISFKNIGPGRTARSQTIRVTGTHEYGRLYRDIIITVQPIQPMRVTCDQKKIDAYKGARESVTVSIPDGLVESMFPLEFIIEPEDMTLTPDTEAADNNLPVSSGTSISENAPYQGKTAFYFLRSVSWQEYKALPRTQDEEGQSWRAFTCHFKSNCIESATRVWVYNPFFEKQSDTFVTRHDRRFVDIGFMAPVYDDRTDQSLPVEFTMTHDADDYYPEDYPVITVTVTGLNIPSETLPSNITRDASNANVYYYTPVDADDRHIVLPFLTTTADPDEISVSLTAEGYYPGQIAPVRFPMALLLDGQPLRNTNNDGWSNSTWSNVAWGYVNQDNNKTIVFGYKDHPDHPNTTVTLTLNAGLRDFYNASIRTVTVTPTGPRNINGDPDYHEIELRTISGKNDADLVLTANGYVAKRIRTGRFQGNIRTIRDFVSKPFAKNNTYGFSMANPTFDFADGDGMVRVTFDRISAEPDGKVVFATAGDVTNRTYTMTIESLISNQTLFWVDMFFNVSGSTVMAPDPNLFRPSVGTVTRYWGSNNQYVWNIPYGNRTASLTFTAPAEHNVILGTFYVKAFNGSLYEGGVKVR